MAKELWVRWKCPVTIGGKGNKKTYLQILANKDGSDPNPRGTLGTLLEHLRYCKRFDYKVEENFLIVEHPFERGPNIALRKKLHAARAKSFCCSIEYFWR